MASGFGIHGGQGRCYKYWMEYSECVSTAMDPRNCQTRRDDYIECLHHRKEYSRYKAIHEEKKRQEESAKGGSHGHH